MVDHEQVVLEDSHRAHQLQAMLLPKLGLCSAAWETYYDYSPAWLIGGDYCDLVTMEDDLFFFLGDAVGKGIAGSIIAAQLHALFRALLPLELPLAQLCERVNRVFCESGASDYYATVVCGRASSDGALELVNAGHLPPLLLRSDQAMPLFASGPPLGLFPTSRYSVKSKTFTSSLPVPPQSMIERSWLCGTSEPELRQTCAGPFLNPPGKHSTAPHETSVCGTLWWHRARLAGIDRE